MSVEFAHVKSTPIYINLHKDRIALYLMHNFSKVSYVAKEKMF